MGLGKFTTVILRLASAAGLFLVVMIGAAVAGSSNVDSNGLALQGYDPVAYFTESKPVKGTTEFIAEYDGAKYQFASDEHLQMFKADPAKFAPQYGGYCAYGLAYGSKAPVEIDKFSVVDGKLYLNFDGNIQSRWVKDVPGFIAKADENWKNLN